MSLVIRASAWRVLIVPDHRSFDSSFDSNTDGLTATAADWGGR